MDIKIYIIPRDFDKPRVYSIIEEAESKVYKYPEAIYNLFCSIDAPEEAVLKYILKGSGKDEYSVESTPLVKGHTPHQLIRTIERKPNFVLWTQTRAGIEFLGNYKNS